MQSKNVKNATIPATHVWMKILALSALLPSIDKTTQLTANAKRDTILME